MVGFGLDFWSCTINTNPPAGLPKLYYAGLNYVTLYRNKEKLAICDSRFLLAAKGQGKWEEPTLRFRANACTCVYMPECVHARQSMCMCVCVFLVRFRPTLRRPAFV